MLGLSADELGILELSLRVASVSVLCSLPLAILVAFGLARFSFPGKTLVDAAVHLPLVLPPVVVGFALLVLLGKRGPIGSLLDEWFGIVIAFRWTGAALASAVMGFPLMVRAIRLSIEAIDRRLEVAGRTLGASRTVGVRVDYAAARAAGRHHRHAPVVRARARRVRGDDHVRIQHPGRDPDAAACDLHVHAGSRRRRTSAAPFGHRRDPFHCRARGFGMADPARNSIAYR